MTLSPESALLVGVDVGTTNIKSAAFTPLGKVVAQASAPTPTNVPAQGQAHYHAEELWRAVAATLGEVTSALRERSASVAGVAVASMGESGVPLDAFGEPTAETLAWFDPRPSPQAQQLEEALGRDRLFKVTGLTPLPVYGLPKLMWLREHRPQQFGRTSSWLHVADYIAFRLCGVQATDPSLASRTLAFDLGRRAWDAGIMRDLGLPLDLLAPLRPSGSPLGGLTREAASLTGLPAGATVAVGGQDHVCGALALGVTEPGEVLNSLGTAEVMLAATERPVRDVRFAEQGFAQGAHVVPGRYYAFGAMFSSGASVDWARTLLGVTSDEDYRALLAEARLVPAGSRGAAFLPHLHLANAPHEDLAGRGALLGLRAGHDPAAVLRAVLEGLAHESRLSLDSLIPYLGAPPQRVTAIGGSARNSLLIAIKANVIGRAIEVARVPEAVCLGAALLAGVGAGVFADARQAASSVTTERERVEPDPALTERYAALHDRVYRQLYGALRPLNHAIAALDA